MGIQIYWIKKAFNIESRKFQQTVFVALNEVAADLAAFHHITLPEENLVKQISSNYYVVNVNSVIDANMLEFFLKSDLAKRKIHTDFEYAIYDCQQNKMMYGNYINVLDKTVDNRKTVLPTYNEYTYYFGVNFPNQTGYLIDNMEIWIYSTVFLLLVSAFFAYALFIILEQKRFSEMQRDFINNLTHEFKTPISTIAISSNVLSEDKITEDKVRYKNYVNIIRSENERLNTQVEKVLQLNKLERGATNLKLEQVELVAILNEVVANFEIKVKEKNGRFELSVPEHPIEIIADRHHLTNIIYNILDNALKYSKEIPIIHACVELSQDIVYLKIRDEGLGIPKEYQQRVFEKFFRVPTGNKHDVKGFGIGLSYVKSVVQAHKWKILLKSEVNKGTEIVIIMPLSNGKS